MSFIKRQLVILMSLGVVLFFSNYTFKKERKEVKK